MLEKPKLFLDSKQFWLSMLFLSSLLAIRIFLIYSDYKEFKDKPFYFTEVNVLQAYEKYKNNRYYTVLKLYSSDLDIQFFTISSIPSKEIYQRLRMKLFPNFKMRFMEYLGTSFISSQVNEIYPKESDLKGRILDYIDKQHQNSMVANFYSAIFLAKPLSKALRKQVSILGVSHLIALSGFHLGILSGLLFFLLRPIYRVFQQRYFPYRFDLIDVGFIVLIILAGFVWFVGSPPSLIRSYMMILSTWILLILGVELLTLSFLVTVILILLIIFPHLLLSLAFWLSIIGVFYIFLLLHYISHLNNITITALISFGLFVLMLPIVHIVFPIVSPLQLGSPFLSLIFTLFYPLSIFLHLICIGDILDSVLIQLFTLKGTTLEIVVNPFLGGAYLLLSIGAFYFRKIFYLLLIVAFGFFIYFFIYFWI